MRPLALGADVVVQSLTKAAGASGRSMGGAVIARHDLQLRAQPSELTADFAGYLRGGPVRDMGAVISPFNAWTLLSDIRELRGRVDAMSASALSVAEHLAECGSVTEVFYPGLKTHRSHSIAKRDMRLVDSDLNGQPAVNRFGFLLCFRPAGGAQVAHEVVDRFNLIWRANNLGQVKSSTRAVLVSPPRTGSTAIARLLWQHSAITHHCHEPFEASYWGNQGADSVRNCLFNPMEIATGNRVSLTGVPQGSGLLVKEMSFQLSLTQLDFLTKLGTVPPVFVMCDPRLSTTSRLRIVRELYGKGTFPPFESGWESLGRQLEYCRQRDIPYVLVDSDDLRADPAGVTAALMTAMGLPPEAGLQAWSPRPGLQLCSPEVGALMSEARRTDDPFYRKVLSSKGIQSRASVDWERENAMISAAGLSDDVEKWLRSYQEMRADRALIAIPSEKEENNAHAGQRAPGHDVVDHAEQGS